MVFYLVYYFKNNKIDDKYLVIPVAHKDFVQIKNNDLYNYYHFTLENDGDDDKRYGVYANGILAESSSKNEFLSRNYMLIE